MGEQWLEFTESDTVTRKRPEGRTRLFRADRIDTISDTYVDGGCTISVAGYHYHITSDRETVVAMISMDTVGPSTGPL